MNVAIQGGRGSFHELAAKKYYTESSIELVECRDFRDMCRRTAAGESERCVMAIENTLVGSILPNHALIDEFGLSCVGEIYVRIEHHLLALPGQKLTDISIVRSHPMALLQCGEFLDSHPHLTSEETKDTAQSAMIIRDRRLLGIAAIASREAAAIYRLQILSEGIENLKENYTRFLILSGKANKSTSQANKASLRLRIKHRVGGLADVLEVFRKRNINLTLIQSIAVPARPHEYAFLLDFEFSDPTSVSEITSALTSHCKEVTVHGVYRGGTKPQDCAYGKTA